MLWGLAAGVQRYSLVLDQEHRCWHSVAERCHLWEDQSVEDYAHDVLIVSAKIGHCCRLFGRGRRRHNTEQQQTNHEIGSHVLVL